MDDELDFLEFLGLIRLMNIDEAISEFTLYNPNTDDEYDFISINDNFINYRNDDSGVIKRQINDLREWIVICPRQSEILSSKLTFENYKGFKFSVSYSRDLPTIKCFNSDLQQSFEVEVDIKPDHSHKRLKDRIDNFILNDEDILLSFSDKKEDYLRFKIFQFQHAAGTRLIAKFKGKTITDDVSEISETQIYHKIDKEVLSDINLFQFSAETVEDELNCRTLYLKTTNLHNFKTFSQFKVIHESSNGGAFEEIKALHLQQVDDYCLDRAVTDHEFFERISFERFYADVLKVQFVNLKNKHYVKVFLEDSEILSELGDGPAEKKLQTYLGKVKSSHSARIGEIIEENHRKFKVRNVGSFAPILISYDEKRYVRMTHCWSCKSDIDSLNFYTCDECTGIICFCGACFCSHTGY